MTNMNVIVTIDAESANFQALVVFLASTGMKYEIKAAKSAAVIKPDKPERSVKAKAMKSATKQAVKADSIEPKRASKKAEAVKPAKVGGITRIKREESASEPVKKADVIEPRREKKTKSATFTPVPIEEQEWHDCGLKYVTNKDGSVTVPWDTAVNKLARNLGLAKLHDYGYSWDGSVHAFVGGDQKALKAAHKGNTIVVTADEQSAAYNRRVNRATKRA